MHASDIPVDQEGALGLCRVLLRAAENTGNESAGRSEAVSPVRKRLSLFERFDRWMAGIKQRDRERYLAQATDIFDLERRIRELERGRYY